MDVAGGLHIGFYSLKIFATKVFSFEPYTFTQPFLSFAKFPPAPYPGTFLSHLSSPVDLHWTLYETRRASIPYFFHLRLIYSFSHPICLQTLSLSEPLQNSPINPITRLVIFILQCLKPLFRPHFFLLRRRRPLIPIVQEQ